MPVHGGQKLTSVVDLLCEEDRINNSAVNALETPSSTLYNNPSTTDPDGLINGPLLGEDALADVLQVVYHELTLDAVVEDHCSVGHVEPNEPDDGHHYQTYSGWLMQATHKAATGKHHNITHKDMLHFDFILLLFKCFHAQQWMKCHFT